METPNKATQDERDFSKYEVPMPKLDFPREKLSELLVRRFFIAPAFSIYGGVAGLYDYGPPGCAVKTNLLDFWRQHFVLHEGMLEVDCTCTTPEEVLIASEHVKKFQDLMVKDTVNGNCLRADHLLEEHIEKLIATTTDAAKKQELESLKERIDDLDQEQLGKTLVKYDVKSPDGNAITSPFPFNLMFEVSIGPSGNKRGYLRPETAQGIFVNFKRLLDFNGGKLPFAAAQIGLAYRNEIAPRAGVLRVREFQMAEIEHFVHETQKNHPRFADVKDIKMSLYPRAQQLGSGKLLVMTVGEAVEFGIIGNQTLAYFMARTQSFLLGAGIKSDGLRFRQHLANEKAHYAQDCWDAEIKNSFGWTECVGHADRSCFDLTQHTKASKEQLVAYEKFDEPRMVNVVKLELTKAVIGKTFKQAAKGIVEALERLSEDEQLNLKKQLESGSAVVTVGNDKHSLTPEMVKVVSETKKVNGRNFLPHVIEPSFGIGRIVYSILEHSFWTRKGDEARHVLSLPPRIAPVKCSVLPLVGNEKIEAYIPKLTSALTAAGLSSKVDATGQSIGRRYARTDEIGIPFGITIDFDTLTDNTVTLRERDTTAQIRVPLHELPQLLVDMVEGRKLWADVSKQYPAQEAKEEETKKD